MKNVGSSGDSFLKRKLLTYASPPAVKKQAQEVSEPEIQDTVKLAKAKPQKTSFLRKLAKMGLTTLQLSGAVGGAGVGVAVATNYEVVQEAMDQKNPVYGYAKKLNLEKETAVVRQTVVDVTPENVDLNKLQNHLDIKSTPESMTATLEAEKAQALLNTVLQSEKVQVPLKRELAKLETKINQKLSDIHIKPGEALFEANIPFPSGEGSLLQIAGRDIPVGMRKLKLEEIPLVLKHNFNRFDTGVEVELNPAKVDKAPLPQGESVGLHLLSARAKASNPDLANTEFSGSIRLEVDDGSATRRALKKTQDPARRKLLQERLVRIERLKELVGEQELDGLIDFALGHRELSFKGHLGGEGKGMGDAKVHAWLTPDEDGDGHAEVKLSSEIKTPGLSTIEFAPEKMEHVATRETGLKGRLQDKISGKIEEKAFEAAPGILEGLRGTIDGEIRKVLAEELAKGQLEVDALLDGTLDVVSQSTEGVGLELTHLDVQEKSGGLRASVRSTNGRTLKEALGPKATVRMQTEQEKEIVAPEMLPMVGITNSDSTMIAVQSNQASIVIPGSNARKFLSSVLANPETQKAFDSLTLSPREQIAEKASALPGLSGSVYIDVELPFPGNENIKSPLGPIPTLSHKNVPIEAKYKVNEFGLDVAVDAKLLDVKEAARPKAAEKDGVFIGAIGISTRPMTTKLDGSVEVQKHDTDGGAPWAEEALDEAFEQQNFDFSTEVSLDSTEAIFYLWLTPDSNGDGRADVAIGHRTVKTGADGAKVKIASVNSNQGKLDLSSRLGGRLNGIVNRVVTEQIEKSSDGLTKTISKLLESKVDGLLGQGSEKVSDAINEKLPGFYDKLENVEVGLPKKLSPEGNLNLGLKELEVKGDSLVLNYGDERVGELLAGNLSPTVSNQKAEDGELLLSLPGDIFNRLVEDKRDGGPMDWDPLLNELVDDSGIIKKLKLATNKEGDPMSPELKIVDGKPVLSLSIDAQTNGIGSPVSMGAKKLPGFLGDGLGWVADNTVGAVLGSRLRTEIQVPIEFNIKDGVLQVTPGDADFVKPAEKGKKSIADFIPTRALSGVVTKGLANAFGPKAINKLLDEVSPTVNPGEYGLDWSRVNITADENGSPLITVGVKANDDLPNLLLKK